MARLCSEAGCPALLDTPGRCITHQRQHDQQRGTRQQRGYGPEHDRLRTHWAPRVATGRVKCWRCNTPITPTEPWDLGHDDSNRNRYRGPEHAHCNRAAGGRLADH